MSKRCTHKMIPFHETKKSLNLATKFPFIPGLVESYTSETASATVGREVHFYWLLDEDFQLLLFSMMLWSELLLRVLCTKSTNPLWSRRLMPRVISPAKPLPNYDTVATRKHTSKCAILQNNWVLLWRKYSMTKHSRSSAPIVFCCSFTNVLAANSFLGLLSQVAVICYYSVL